MMPEEQFDFETILKVLARHAVDFIVVGGVCAAIHGAPVVTYDLDIVHSRDLTNLKKLEEALRELEAYYREHLSRRIVPESPVLGSPGHHLLMTSVGPLDVLGTIVGNRDYERLLPHTVEVTLAEGLQIRILDLPTLIQVKQETGRDQDKWVLPILRRTLEEIERSRGKSE